MFAFRVREQQGGEGRRLTFDWWTGNQNRVGLNYLDYCAKVRVDLHVLVSKSLGCWDPGLIARAVAFAVHRTTFATPSWAVTRASSSLT